MYTLFRRISYPADYFFLILGVDKCGKVWYNKGGVLRAQDGSQGPFFRSTHPICKFSATSSTFIWPQEIPKAPIYGRSTPNFRPAATSRIFFAYGRSRNVKLKILKATATYRSLERPSRISYLKILKKYSIIYIQDKKRYGG